MLRMTRLFAADVMPSMPYGVTMVSQSVMSK